MKLNLKGPFEIQRTALPALDLNGISLSRMRFNKTFQGELSGQSVVEMMGLMLEGTGSGGYVALEHFVAEIGGRSGSFVLQHSSLMDRGKPVQHITVVPDSGTKALTGLSGTMTIDIVDGKHFYNCAFEMP